MASRHLQLTALTGIVACSFFLTQAHASEPPSSTAEAQQLTAEKVFVQASPAVVRVVVYDRDFKVLGQGSGFVVSANGLLITNCHVVEDAYFAFAVSHDGTRYPIEGHLGFNRVKDIALLKVQMQQAPFLVLSNSKVRVGSKVYAIGNPRGLTNTISEGLISGLRSEDESGNLIQTTAPISPGSSGGPLLSGSGEVVGITTSYLVGGQNLNFAVPAEEAIRLIQAGVKISPLASATGSSISREDSKSFADFWRSVEQKDFGSALKSIGMLKERYSSTAQYWFALGYIQSCLENYDVAVDAYKTAIKIDPAHGPSYHNLGLVYLKVGELNKAIASLRSLVALEPNDVGAVQYLTSILASVAFRHLEKGVNSEEAAPLFREAVQLLERTIQIDPKNPLPYSSLGKIHSGMAFYHRTAYLGILPSEYSLARDDSIYLENPDRRKAIQGYRLACSACTNGLTACGKSKQLFEVLADAWKDMTFIYERESRIRLPPDQHSLIGVEETSCLEKLVDAQQSLVDLDKTNTELHLELGMTLNRLSWEKGLDWNRRAQQAYEAILEHEPRNHTALSFLAGVYEGRREYSKALELYKRAETIKPHDQSRDNSTEANIEALKKKMLHDLEFDLPTGWFLLPRSEYPGIGIGKIAEFSVCRDAQMSNVTISIVCPTLSMLDTWPPRTLSKFVEREAELFGMQSSQVVAQSLATQPLRVNYLEIKGCLNCKNVTERFRNEGFMLLAAFVEGPSGPWIVSTIGPESAVSKERDNFKKMIGTLKCREWKEN